jgi:tetratricopeptide (TPR) repeat protein
MKKYTDKEISELIVAENYPKVIEYLKDVVKTEEASFHDLAAFIYSVSHFKETKLYPLAFDCFIKANLMRNPNPILLRNLYIFIDEIVEVLGFRYFDEVNSKNISREFYLKARFMLFIKANKYLDAINTMTQLIKERALPVYYFQRSKVYFLTNKFKLAIQDLDEGIKLAPTIGQLYFHRGLVKQRINDIQGALFDFDSAINFEPNNFVYYYKRGVLHEDLGRFKNALDDFKKSVQLNPNNVSAMQEIAWCKYNMHSYREAMYFADLSTKMAPHNCSGHYIKGCIFSAVKDFDNALNSLELAAKNDNQSNKSWSARLWYQSALTSFLAKKFDKAQQDIIKAIQLKKNIIAFLILAMDIEFFGMHNWISAKNYCESVLKIDNQNQRALAAKTEIDKKLTDEIL